VQQASIWRTLFLRMGLTQGLISSIEGAGHGHPFIVLIPSYKKEGVWKRTQKEAKKYFKTD